MPLLVVAGPTATGKTEIAVAIAEAVGGEIISADSMQIYKPLDIGTAKPTVEQRARARFHLIDVVNPDEPYNVARFAADAHQAVKEIHQRGHLPILCGGTGLYIRAVLHHYDFPPGPANRGVRERLRREAERVGGHQMHQRLQEVDPDSAARLAPNDLKRIIRALEVYQLTGRPTSAQQSVDDSPDLEYKCSSFVVCCPRAILYRRIEQRVEQMLSAGWLEEVKHLGEAGYHSGLQSMQALGYRHLLVHLEGRSDWPTTVATIKRDTRRFAKRQLTWFRHQEDFTWLTWANQAQFHSVLQAIVATARTIKAISD